MVKSNTQPEKKIAVLICYFGKLPWYFDYYVHSCIFNPSIDFYILTDDTTYVKETPANLKIIITSLNDISELATKKLELPIKITRAYKLCDFKPTYGILFSDILSAYDFWVCGDIDVIYGNIRNFITTDLLEKYELISVRPDWVPGCFILFKNIEKINKLYTHSKDHKKILTSESHFCFDETNFAHDAFTEGKKYTEIITEVESMMHVIKRLEETGYIKPYWDLFIVEGIPGKLKWNLGTLTYRDRYEIMLYHLIRLKKKFIPKTMPVKIPDSFSISSTAIHLENISASYGV